MQLFTQTTAEQQRFADYVTKVDKMTEELVCLQPTDLAELRQLKESFQLKIDDFYKAERKLNIGIIGQVKAGKSSFLNTLIFDGKDVLPRASTPKTATLTKIEYAAQNSMEIHYYTPEEWQQIEGRAKAGLDSEEHRVARAIYEMSQTHTVDVQYYLRKGTEKRTFPSEEALMSELNRYVGENGELTAFVKYVTLKINNPLLQDISIVDTPGLNDPIASRTDKTKQFMEVCDVVFFLSYCSKFLDQTDMTLLTSQLPQKGVKRLVLIASRYDEGLQDTLYDYDSLEEADVDTKKILRRKAIKDVTNYMNVLEQRGASAELLAVLKECTAPIFVSSMAHNMSRKDKSAYAKDECLVFDNLNEFGDLTEDMLYHIGNIGEVRQVLEEVISQKETTLLAKAKSFLPLAEEQLTNVLQNLLALQKRRLTMLIENDHDTLQKQKRAIAQQMTGIEASVTSIFTAILVKLETSKTEGTIELREASREYARMSERTGVDIKMYSYQVSTSKLFQPSTWGTSRTEYQTVETRYQYLDVSDALENIRNFGHDAVRTVEETFLAAVDFHQLKRRLLTTVIDYFDTSSAHYDPAFFKLVTEKTIQEIELPVIQIDIRQQLEKIASSFSGEIRDATAKNDLRNQLAHDISQILEEISAQFVEEVRQFKEAMTTIEQQFTSRLLMNIAAEFDVVLAQFASKEQEIDKLRAAIEIIEGLNQQ